MWHKMGLLQMMKNNIQVSILFKIQNNNKTDKMEKSMS